ncbi:probable carboxylesterase 18 [Salvia miltiorrhiza]|uniref:probable carboxylesterase 18 n=1 Tax=Salvia miltiorrhiza TaxID=226208 RepID=UPI0025AD277B|nr:probable carboxylesterase 18 [Salvia miltiorrhiza]
MRFINDVSSPSQTRPLFPRNTKMASLPLLTRLKLLMFDLITYMSTRRDGSVNQLLFRLVDSKTSAPATKRINTVRVSTSDITIDPSRNLWFRLFNPATPTSEPLPLIVYFHGGGFANYAPDTKHYSHLCCHLAAGTPAVVASVNYRLCPDHKYPTQYEDALDALKFIDAKCSDVLPANTDLARCFIGGDSAGGNIAHHVTVRFLEKMEQFDKMRIAGIIGLQPFFGGEERTESEVRLTKAPLLSVKQTDVYWRDFLPDGADRNHPAAHVFGGGGVKNVEYPASLVVVGGNDPLQDWDTRYAEWLKDCGKRVVVAHYPNAFHGFYVFPEMPEFALCIRDVANFVRQQLHSN